MGIADLILNVLAFIMLLILAWFSFQVANIAVTIFRQRKRDKTFKFCLNQTGKVFYLVLTFVFIAVYIGGFATIVYSFTYDNLDSLRIAINFMALITVFYSYMLSSIIMLGRKEMMIGRMLIDYRKMKKVSFSLHDKVTFIFSQKEYSFSTTFTDVMEIRRALKK